MAVISTGNHPKSLWPGIHAWFGVSYSKYPTEYTNIFDVKSSEKNYEEDVEATGFGLAPQKTEGGATSYNSHTQGPVTRYTHTAYALGYIVTKEELDNDQYEKLARSRSESLAFSMRTTKEIVAALILDRAFNSSFTGGNGKELCSTSHPTVSGNQANMLSTAADFSEASLEDMLILIAQAKNARGLQIALQPQKLIIPVNETFNVRRVLMSDGRVGTADNDMNASKGMISGGYEISHFVTDTDAWFIKTNAPNGLTMFQRKELEFTKDNNFDTENAKAKAYERYSFKWSDWRGCYGTAGA